MRGHVLAASPVAAAHHPPSKAANFSNEPIHSPDRYLQRCNTIQLRSNIEQRRRAVLPEGGREAGIAPVRLPHIPQLKGRHRPTQQQESPEPEPECVWFGETEGGLRRASIV